MFGKLTVVNMASEKMRGLGGMQTFYYLQLLLAGDTETGRKPARFHAQRPLAASYQSNARVNSY